MPRTSQAVRVSTRREFLLGAGLLSLGAGLLSACSAPAPAAPTAKPASAASGEATLVLGVDAESLDPLVTTNAFSRSMMKAIFDTLVVLDPKLAPQPALATSWET